ncbi:gamma-butyrobetaine dioxygenase-like isoform X1 [Schistocerca americana]|uniref:gamma-butyrobetaine dioxygenase-like isoform X1 n=1 Tax=Schistocerca americana TaxID=7009 RepID=UPI001F4F2B94|nr:gamma-butyrobetaine dioxygenase-like isoform X1 [Schistocerca americana]XP_047003045.1 gamma-butyrobetaine dioxygenase-like isoform X1 [Schistocerca americana]
MLRAPVLGALRSLSANLASRRLLTTKSKATALVQGEVVSVQFPEGDQHKFPTTWLRDNCQCSACFSPHMHSRLIHWRNFDVDVHPLSVEAADGNFNIKWSDGHNSSFQFDWLKERNFTSEKQKQWLSKTYRAPKETWNTQKFQSIIKRFKFADIIKSDQSLLLWLEALAVYGVAIVTETPSSKEEISKLANRIAFPRKTHYGETFEVKHKPGTTNSAYLNTPLQMHTDLPYYEYKPGLNLLHCLVQTDGPGGENLITDGFYVGNHMKKHNPDFYKLLSTVPVEWLDIGEEDGIKFHTLYRAPVICEDMFGQIIRINYSQPQRDSHFNVPLETAVSWYKAYHAFTKALYHPENVVMLKNSPGDILTFDNIRLIHAREGYTDNVGHERHIIGVYLDWDIAYARIRVLRQNAGMLKT